MKPLLIIVFISLGLISCRKIIGQTVVVGHVRDNITKKPLSNVRVGVFGMSNNFSANSYGLIEETFTDEDGYYKIVSYDYVEIVHAALTGYFDEPDFKSRTIKENSKNEIDINLVPACKVNFTLVNKGNWPGIYVDVSNAKAKECDQSSNWFYQVKTDTTTSCYIWGGESVKVEYGHSVPNTHTIIRGDTTISFPVGGEKDVILNYN